MRHQHTQTRQVADEALERSFAFGVNGNAAAQAQPSWFVDPANSTGNASNANTGTTAGAPLLTYAEIVRRWGTTSPTIVSPITTITFLSNQPDFTDPINLSPILANGTSMVLAGQITPVISDVISVYTPRVRSPVSNLDSIQGTGILDFTPYKGMLVKCTYAALRANNTVSVLRGAAPPAVTLTGVATQSLEPLEVRITLAGALGVAQFSWFINGVLQQAGVVTAAAVPLGATGITANFPVGAYTDGANPDVWDAWTDAWFWIDATAVAVATLSPPMATAVDLRYSPPFNNNAGVRQRIAPPWQIPAVGDTITVFAPTKVFVENYSVTLGGTAIGAIPISGSPASSLFAQHLELVTPPTTTMCVLGAPVVLQECKCDGLMICQESFGLAASFINCLSTVNVAGGFTCIYGGSFANFGDEALYASQAAILDGDVIVHGGILCAQAEVVLSFVYSALLINIYDQGDCYIEGNANGTVFYTQSQSGQGCPTGAGPAAAVWGPGKIAIFDGRAMRIVSGTGATAITATGSLLLTGVPTATVDGLSAAGSALSTFTPGAPGTWTNAAVATTPLATLVALLDAPGPGITSAIQNPNTGSRIGMNANNAAV